MVFVKSRNPVNTKASRSLLPWTFNQNDNISTSTLLWRWNPEPVVNVFTSHFIWVPLSWHIYEWTSITSLPFFPRLLSHWLERNRWHCYVGVFLEESIVSRLKGQPIQSSKIQYSGYFSTPPTIANRVWQYIWISVWMCVCVRVCVCVCLFSCFVHVCMRRGVCMCVC